MIDNNKDLYWSENADEVIDLTSFDEVCHYVKVLECNSEDYNALLVTTMQIFLWELYKTIKNYIFNNNIDVDNIENSSIPDYWLKWTLTNVHDTCVNIIDENGLLDELQEYCQNKINDLLEIE